MGGCCSACMDKAKGITAYGVVMTINYITFVFGLLMVILGIVSLSSTGEAFFSNETYVFMIIFGLLTFGMIYLGCIGARDPKDRPNYLFCYWCLVSVLIIGNVIGFYYFRVFSQGLERAANDGDNGVLSAFETQVAKEAQDFVLSVYTTCCTGCNQGLVPNCEESFAAADFSGVEFCNNNFVQGDESFQAGDCFFADICTAEQLQTQFEEEGVSDGLGLGCYTTLETIPGFGLESDTCTVFKELDIKGRNLVGPASENKCGGGDPAQFVDDVVEYFNSRYLLIALPWGLLIATLSMAWLASFIMILFHSGGRSHK